MTEKRKKKPSAPRKISDEQKAEIAERLQSRGVRPDCPMCGKSGWIMADGYLNEALQGTLKYGLMLGGPSLPSAVIVCSNCGFMSQHALGVLGLMEETTGEG